GYSRGNTVTEVSESSVVEVVDSSDGAVVSVVPDDGDCDGEVDVDVAECGDFAVRPGAVVLDDGEDADAAAGSGAAVPITASGRRSSNIRAASVVRKTTDWRDTKPRRAGATTFLIRPGSSRRASAPSWGSLLSGTSSLECLSSTEIQRATPPSSATSARILARADSMTSP